jgi:hypothetical protein
MTTRWSLSQAIVWIAKKDASLANDLRPRCTIFEAGFVVFEAALASVRSEALSPGALDIDAETEEGIARRKDLESRCLALVWDAREKLLDTLRNKRAQLIASGRANGVGNTGPIETELWLGLTLHDEPGSRPGHGVVARPEDGLNFSATWFDEISFAVDDVQRIWPGPEDDHDNRTGGLLASGPGLSRATDDQIRDWMIRYQRDLKDAGKRHGREIILSAAREQFGVRHKVVLAIWNARTNRKTGKPSSRRKKKSP